MDIEISESSRDGYNPLIHFNGWRVAVANGGERFSEKNLTKLERHTETDEVFVLLSGKAELIIGIEAKRYALEEKKLYNVKKGIWHGLIAEENSAVLVIENDNTSSENTEYEVDQELGGEQALRDAVKEIHDMGGKVLLYSNGNLIDVKIDYYKKTGQRICTKDIDLNECREHYRFSNNGTLLHCYGHKSFVTACHNTREWQEQLVNIGKTKLSFGADCIFYDQLGINSKLCFDKSHPHGNRIDTEPQARYENIWKIREILSDDQAIGTEWAIDRYACSVDFIHGCGEGFAYIGVNMFPDMFLNTFPECVMSNRFIHDDKDGFEQHLNYAFVFGLVFDVSIYRGRGSISDCLGYGEYVKKRSARNDACYGAGSRKIQYQSKRSFAGNDKNRPLG